MPIQWEKVSLFDSICKRYVELSKQRVGPVVVGGGDGNGPSTKDSTHQRRARGIVGWQLLTTTKEIFLSNETNKKKIYYSWNNTWKQKERGQSKRVEIQIAWFLTQELICSLYYIIVQIACSATDTVRQRGLESSCLFGTSLNSVQPAHPCWLTRLYTVGCSKSYFDIDIHNIYNGLFEN